jgi:hypothetical protein
MSAYVHAGQQRRIAHSRLQEADRVVDAYETAEKRILVLQDKLGAGNAMVRDRLAACQEQLAMARGQQEQAWVAWELVGNRAR